MASKELIKQGDANKQGSRLQVSVKDRSPFFFLFLRRALVDAESSFDEEPGRQNMVAARQERLLGDCPFFMIVGFKGAVSVKCLFNLNGCLSFTSKTAVTWRPRTSTANFDFCCHRCSSSRHFRIKKLYSFQFLCNDLVFTFPGGN